MASIFFTILPIMITFGVASWAPASKAGPVANLESCTHC
jgi:hypothetical protein